MKKKKENIRGEKYLNIYYNCKKETITLIIFFNNYIEYDIYSTLTYLWMKTKTKTERTNTLHINNIIQYIRLICSNKTVLAHKIILQRHYIMKSNNVS